MSYSFRHMRRERPFEGIQTPCAQSPMHHSQPCYPPHTFPTTFPTTEPTHPHLPHCYHDLIPISIPSTRTISLPVSTFLIPSPIPLLTKDYTIPFPPSSPSPLLQSPSLSSKPSSRTLSSKPSSQPLSFTPSNRNRHRPSRTEIHLHL